MTTRTSVSMLGAALLGAGLLASGCASSGGAGKTLASAATPVCTTSSFPIYFERGSDQLTRDSVQVLQAATKSVAACSVSKLDVVGLAGAAEGPPAQALELAQRRSVVVADALKASGLPEPRFDMGAVGAAGVKPKGGRTEPLRRRTEVIIYAGAQKTASR